MRRPRQILCRIIALLAFPLASCFAQTSAQYHQRADQALQSFLLKFWSGGSHYLLDAYPTDGKNTGYWTFAHGWDAVMDGIERTGGQQYAGWIETFYLVQNQSGWIDGYYDDECWMGNALTRAYDLTTNQTNLAQAASLYADIMGGWDTGCCGGTPGGLWWDKAHTSKATAANAGAALLGARLAIRAGNSTYLSFAEKVYGFWYTNMVDPSTYEVCDHFQTNGTKVWWKFTYNEGLMIGASIALYQATGDSSYLAKADNIANFMIANEVIATTNGSVLYDGDNSGCGGDCHEFKGPAYRYLMQLYTNNITKVQYSSVLNSSANAIWNSALNSTSLIFSVNWAGPPQTNADEAQDNAACIALNRRAEESGPYPGSGIPPNQYEAENATLHNLGVEALYGAFNGWAYVAGWNANGQSIDFTVTVPSAGVCALAFRYAAGAGNASRVISVNYVNAYTNQSFANTGSWSVYSTNVVTVTLAAGVNDVSIAYNSNYGNGNYLNLDNLTVIPLQIVMSGTEVPSGTVHLSWNTVPGLRYRVQSAPNFTSGPWTTLGSPLTAATTSLTFDDTNTTIAARFYRAVTP